MKIINPVILCLCAGMSAQNISSAKWEDFFSYNNVLAIRNGGDRLMAATENGVFYYHVGTGEISKLSKANGLHEVKISAFDYNPLTQTALIGYNSGTIDVVTPEGVTYIVDIPLATSYAGSKRINHISISGNMAVISTDYGVSVFNIERKEFGDTAFFVNNSVYESAREAIIKDNIVYVLTNSGLFRHPIDNTFPVFSTWENIYPGNYHHIAGNDLYIAFSGESAIFLGDGIHFDSVSGVFSSVKDLSFTPEHLLITEDEQVHTYNHSGQPIQSYNMGTPLNSAWTYDGQIFAGTRIKGILDIHNRSYMPVGPLSNRAYKMYLKDGKMWVATGGMTGRYNAPPSENELPDLGFLFFDGKEWFYPSYFEKNEGRFNIIDVVANPSDDHEVFFTNLTNTSTQGIFKMRYNGNGDFELQQFYDNGQPDYLNRPVGLTFDDKNNLFATTFVYGNDWLTTYAVYNRSEDKFIYAPISSTKGFGTQKPLFYEGLLLIPTPRSNHFVVANLNQTPTNLNDDEKITLQGNSIGFPSSSTGSVSVAVDKNGDAWVGTDRGLRVISSIRSNYRAPKAEPIIIEQNNIGEELFRDAEILQIAVDTGNQKWISTSGGGVFYVNANGQQTINKFTQENSPLPNNSVTDIKIDDKTGKVYFATLDGIVAYQGDVANVSQNFGDVLVYPNPVVYAKYKGHVRIKGLAEKTNIRITDTAGNLVHQAVARGGYYDWDLNYKGKRVASGVYFVLMTNEDGTDKATAKIAVVN